MFTEPNFGLTYDWQLGENVKPGMDANLAKLGALFFLSVTSRTQTLPGTPTAGTRYIVPAGSPTQADSVAVFVQGAWTYYPPGDGWIARVVDTDDLVVYKAGIGWTTQAPDAEILLDESFNTLVNDDYNVLEAI